MLILSRMVAEDVYFTFVETLDYGCLKLSFSEIDLKVIWERSVKKTSFSEMKN